MTVRSVAMTVATSAFYGLTRKELNRVVILKRRQEFLAGEQRRGATNSFDDSELSALGWVIELAAEAIARRGEVFRLKSYIALATERRVSAPAP